MQAVATGDGAALRELCARWERPLYQLLHRAGAGSEAEDLYQETWLRVVRAARSFDPARRFSTWLFQIALNLCRDLRRRGVPVPASPDVEQAADAATGTSRAPVDDAIDARRLLDALPEPQREVVVLRVLHDASEAETAEILGCPRGTVKSRLHHALARLAGLARGGAADGGVS
ncbi:MAG TPA: sigma-70 family RNA polymerase sigma factor [Candidatus Binatia bacterium]